MTAQDVRAFAKNLGEELPNHVEDAYLMIFIHNLETSPSNQIHFCGRVYDDLAIFKLAIRKAQLTVSREVKS